MPSVQLERLAVEVLAELPDDDTQAAVQDLLHDVAGRSEEWPAPGGEEIADFFGPYCWVSVVAYADGLEVRDVGWCGPLQGGPGAP